MSGRFSKKVALVTGAASGIGRASAVAFAREGAAVAVVDVAEAGAKETVALIKKAEGTARFFQCDVSSGSEVQKLVRDVVAEFGRLDFAHNNAGIEGKQATTVECTEEIWERTIAVNLKGVWLCMKYEIPQMLKQGGGAIVNTASVAGLVGFVGLPAYSASKGGVVQLTRVAALEYAKSNIRVNAVCPGVIKTAMVDRITEGKPDVEAAFTAGEPVGRMGRPEEIAAAVVWLCSDDASFVTGIPMPVDGGWVAQ
jgi:NAD(P)-dependent dehydrogenase (short-subunit alcohol dehydrogenase family)